MLKLYWEYEQSYPYSVGLVHAFIASFGIFLQQVIVKYYKSTYGPGQMTYFRFFFLMVFNAASAEYNKADIYPPKGKLHWITLRNFTGALCSPVLYWALNKIPLQECSIFSQMIPLVVPLLDYAMYGAKYTIYEMLLAFAAVGGVYMVIGTNSGDSIGQYVEGTERLFVLAVMFFGYTVMYTICTVVVKEMKNVSPITINIQFGLIGLVMGAIKSFYDPFLNASLYDFMTVGLGLGIVGTLSQISFIKAYQLAKPGRVSIINSSHIVLAFLVEYLMYDTTPKYIQILGTILIISAMIGSVVLKQSM